MVLHRLCSLFEEAWKSDFCELLGIYIGVCEQTDPEKYPAEPCISVIVWHFLRESLVAF